jgi:hypothetical protein
MPNATRRNLASTALSLSLALVSAATMTATPSQGAGVTGIEQRSRVTELTRQITWFDNYNQALTCAKQRGKPLVWIHMLGQMQGAT